MLMFLTILLAGLAVLAVSCVAFAASAPREVDPPTAPHRPAVEPPRFFAPEAGLPETRSPVPIEVLIRQIERHVRLEQAAAQGFLDVPTSDSLHSRTESPLVN